MTNPQQIMEVTAQLIKVDQTNEVLRFQVNGQDHDVSLTNQAGIDDLKNLYEVLLENLIKSSIEVVLEDAGEGTTKMFQLVCVEYIKFLNIDLKSARAEILNKGLSE